MSSTRNISNIYQEHEVPKNHIVSEGEKLIKNMVQTQLYKNIQLTKELSREKQFEISTELIDLNGHTSGENNLSEFIKCTEKINNLEELKSYGLTGEEIELFIDNERSEHVINSKHKNICKDIMQKKLNNIFEKISKAKTKSTQIINRNNTSISRHIQEIALSTKPNSEETKLYQFALSCSTMKHINNSPIEHPINKLSQIEKDLFDHLNRPLIHSLKKRRKQAKKHLDSKNDKYDFIESENSLKICKDSTSNSKWDIQNKSTSGPFKTYTCEKKQKFTIQNNKIIKLVSHMTNNQTNINDCSHGKSFVACTANNTTIDIKSLKKLTEEEIKSMPRFHTYEKGIPTKVLYIKNLARRTNEQDLVNLFNCFDNEDRKVTYRLLSGNMKGQAFITFNSISQAMKALDSVNGCILNEKAIIIQYGKCTY